MDLQSVSTTQMEFTLVFNLIKNGIFVCISVAIFETAFKSVYELESFFQSDCTLENIWATDSNFRNVFLVRF